MRSYFLIDGMMVYDAMRANKLLHDPEANWCAPLIGGKTHRLIGPMLIDAALAKEAGDAVSTTVGKLVIAFPNRLHLSTIYSEVDLSALADHLRRFAAFYDEDARLVALRFADCRRLVDLPNILTPEQWGDMTSLMAQWTVYNRQGQEMALTLPEGRTELQSDQAFRLSTTQMQALEEFAEPDDLLNRLGYTPQAMASNMTAYWQLAKHCVSLWRKSGNTDGDVLLVFARRIFASQGKALQERDWQQFLAQATSQDVLNLNEEK